MKKAILVLMCGLLLFGVAALADVHFGHMPDEHGMDLRFGDGNELRFGSVASMFWETEDTNANYLAVELPSISATDVPVLMVGIGLDGVDLGFFTGSVGASPQTQPAIVLVDLDRDSWIKLAWSADDKAEFVGGGSVSELDVDFDLIRNTTDDFRIEYDAGAYMNFAMSDTTGNVAITHVGSTKNVAWTTTGAVTFTFGSLDIVSTRSYVGFETATFEHRYSYTGLSYNSDIQTASVNGLEVQNGEALTCVGLDGGAAEIGTTEGYVSLGDDTDFLRFVIPIPCLWVDTDQTESLKLSFDIHEKAGANCDIGVRIFEYGNTTQIITDTIDAGVSDARTWFDLTTYADGIGAAAQTTLTADDAYLIIELTSVADEDDFWIYGVKLLYQTGVQATQ